MTDEQIEILIESTYDTIDDLIDSGCELVTVCSVLFAIALKRLKIELDEDTFCAILEDLTKYQKYDADSDEEISIRQYSVTKRTIH